MFTGNTKSHQETQTVRVIQGLNKRWSHFQSWDDGRVTEEVVLMVAFETGRPACQDGGSGGVCTGEMQLKWAGRSEGLSASVCLPKSPQEVQRRPGGLEMRKGVGRGWQSGTSCCEGGLSPRAPESTADAGLEPCRARWLRVWPLRWSTASAHSQLQVCILNALNDLQVFTSPTFLTFLFWSRCTSL